MSDLHNPHDQFIKILLSDIDAARTFIQRFLPKDTSKLLDLSTLRLTDNSFITDEMSSLYADLVFECELKAHAGKKLLISILIEHKSTPYKFVSLQIGQYILHGYSRQLSDKKRPLQLIIPILYYHGEKKWVPKNLPELFTHYAEHLRVFVPDFQFIFQNITLLTDEEIYSLQNKLLIPGLLIQKYYKDKQALQAILNDIFYLLTLLEDSRNLKKNFFVYIFDLFGEDKTEFMKRMHNLDLPVSEKTKNFFYQLEQEGIDRTIKNLIKEGCTTDFICLVAEVSPEYVEKIRRSMD